MTELSQILEFQQQPLRLLVNARVHAPTVGILLKESIGEQYKTIASVDPNKYLSFLKQALNNSGGSTQSLGTALRGLETVWMARATCKISPGGVWARRCAFSSSMTTQCRL